MIIVLSPAKTLDFETPVKCPAVTQPRFIKEAAQLAGELKKLSVDELVSMMNISEDLANINRQRLRQWKRMHADETCRPAAFAFRGDVYQGLAVDEMKSATLKRLQSRVRILSGLYGVLRPLDLMRPYRLEMGTKLTATHLEASLGKSLYEFWGDRIRDCLLEELEACPRGDRLLVNLASSEYSKAARLNSIDAEVISPVFKDCKRGKCRTLGYYAKLARGMMARYLVEKSVESLDGLLQFNQNGYQYDASLSSPGKPTFTREQPETK